MSQEFISEYGIDPGDYIQRLVDHYCDRCSKLSERRVEEAFFVDDGPIDFLIWFALDGYTDHTFFYRDEQPDQETLRRFMSLAPSEDAMARFKRLLQTSYGTCRELDIARLLEIPDIYQPQFGERPRANIGICYEPETDQIISGVSGTPRVEEETILEDVDKIVPERTLEKFISQTVQDVDAQLKKEADRQLIAANVRHRLARDPDFRHETDKPLPEGIHPKYTGVEAELWQKPASQVEYMDGSQGFLQIWTPIDADEVTLVDATAGQYDRDAIVDATRDAFETA